MQDEFPRLSELQAISIGLGSSDAYFKENDSKFTDPMKRGYFLLIENDLRGLDEQAWQALKEYASQRLIRTKDRDWQPLFDALNEAKAYNYLVSVGCTSVSFIPRSEKQGQRTPDLQALSGSTVTLCEVKTANMSAEERARLRNGGVGTTLLEVKDGLLNKITSDMYNAEDQMRQYRPADDVRRIVYMIVNFDNNADMAKEYQQQVREHVAKTKPPSVEAVLFFKEPFTR